MSSRILKAWNTILGKSQNIQSSHNMLKTISAEHARVHEGVVYSVKEKHTVASSSFVDHLILTNSHEVHLREYDFTSTQGECDIYLYENPFTDVNSLGAENIWKNRNRQSSNVSSSQVFEAPFIDVNSIGEELDYKLIEASAGGAVKQAGGETSGLSEWILPPDTSYLIRFYNNHPANAANVAISLLIYEPTVDE